MKIITLIISIAFLASCNNNQEKQSEVKSEKTPVTTQNKTVKSEENNALKQQGDYTLLYDRSRNECGFINSEMLAEVLNTSQETIIQEANNCTYILTEANGNKTRFHFKIESWGAKTVKKEIKTAIKNAENFGENSTLSQYRISETGDTYLSMHQNRMVRILNENYDNVIVLFYTPEIAPDESDMKKIKDLKATARERAYAVSNFLLKEFQK